MQVPEEEYSNHGSDPVDMDMMDDDRSSDIFVGGGASEKSKNPVLR